MNNETVSVPRELLVRLNNLCAVGWEDIGPELSELSAILSKPAERQVTHQVVARVLGYTPGMGRVELQLPGNLPQWLELRETVTVIHGLSAEQRNAELERDARRYQLLRDDPVTDRIISLMGDGLCGSMLDAAIDDLKPEALGARQEPGIMAE